MTMTKIGRDENLAQQLIQPTSSSWNLILPNYHRMNLVLTNMLSTLINSALNNGVGANSNELYEGAYPASSPASR